jgi:RNA polymerase sigma-70 factor (ECF subfamily)
MSAPESKAEEVAKWFVAARGGSQEALGFLLEMCRPYLLLVANHQLRPGLRSKVSPSDVVQDTFVKAHAHFARFHGGTEEEWLAWLRRILLNNLANVSRHYLATESRRVGREVALDAADPLNVQAQEVDAPADSPSAEAIRQEELGALEQAVGQLPEHYRQIIHWRNWERLSFEEIGERSGRSAEAARKLWARAVEQLTQLLETPNDTA